MASSDEALREVTAEIFEAWLQALTARMAAGGIDPEPARELATMLLTSLEGGFLLSRGGKDTAPMVAVGRAMVQLTRAALLPEKEDL